MVKEGKVHDLGLTYERRSYKFAYVLGVNKTQGRTAGTVLRPVGLV
jgi:hypothetical protein